MVAWRRQSPGAAAPSNGEEEARLRLRPGVTPCTPTERALARIVGEGRPRGEVERELARHLLAEELRCGGWVLDLCVWSRCLFDEEASHLVDRHLGTLLAVER